MGKKIRYLIILLVFMQIRVNAQEKLAFALIDSLTYKYYLNGSWDSLISIGNNAIGKDIDYKYLRQRMGFAYYIKLQFAEAQRHFTKALTFDSYDPFSIEYLYLSYLYSGNDDGASLIAGKMKRETRKSLSVSLFNPVESIEAEYNFKYAGTDLRSNPQYFRVGLNSRLGARFSLFQMYSSYSQTITVRYPSSETYFSDTQPEYYALLKYSISPYIRIKAAWHYLNTDWSITSGSANLGYIGLSADYNKFVLGGEFSIMNIEGKRVTQTGLTAGIKSTGKFRAYFTGELSVMTNADSVKGVIYNQKGGLRLSPRVWLEGNVTFGNLQDYSELSAMYIYNTVDPTSFRCGSTLSVFPGRHISLWFNFSYERKDFYENITYHYNQFSYLGGIKWKISK